MNTPFSTYLKRWFSTGIVALLPIAATVWVIIYLFRWLEALLIKPLFKAEWITNFFLVIPDTFIPWIQALIGLTLIFSAITILGYLTSNVIGKWFLGRLDQVMTKVPLANSVYTFVKGLVENLRMMREGYFKKVVLVEYPRKGIWSVGFIARDLTGTLQASSEADCQAVFIPTSPNPTSGFIIVVEKTEVCQLDISPEEALKFIVSGGVVMPGTLKDQDST